MNHSKKIKELRKSTGMNRREFCEYFNNVIISRKKKNISIIIYNLITSCKYTSKLSDYFMQNHAVT